MELDLSDQEKFVINLDSDLECDDGNESGIAVGKIISDKPANRTGAMAQLRRFWSNQEAPVMRCFGDNL